MGGGEGSEVVKTTSDKDVFLPFYPFTLLPFYLFTLLPFISVCEGCHAGALLEEIGEGALVAEVEVGGNLANGHVGMREEIADFLVEKRGDMLVDGGAADVSDKTHEIGRGDIEFVGIEAYLALFAEVAIEMMEEYLVDLFLVAKVVGNGALLIRQLFEKKLEDVEHTLYHLDFVDVLMAHDVAHEMEDVEHTLVFFVRKLIAARLLCYELVDKATFSLEVGRNVDKGGDFLRSDEQEVVGRKVLDFCISVGMELELALTLFYQEKLGEEGALLHHGREVGIGGGGGINIDDAAVGCANGEMGSVGAKDIIKTIFGGKFF